MRTYRGADGNSDHYLVVAKFSLKLSAKWKRHKRSKVWLEIKTFKQKVTMEQAKHNTIQPEAGKTPTSTLEKSKTR